MFEKMVGLLGCAVHVEWHKLKVDKEREREIVKEEKKRGKVNAEE